MTEISERKFEEAVEEALLRHGPDAPAGAGQVAETLSPYGDTPGGYRRRGPEDTQADVDRFARAYFTAKATTSSTRRSRRRSSAPGRSPRRSGATSAATSPTTSGSMPSSPRC